MAALSQSTAVSRQFQEIFTCCTSTGIVHAVPVAEDHSTQTKVKHSTTTADEPLAKAPTDCEHITTTATFVGIDTPIEVVMTEVQIEPPLPVMDPSDIILNEALEDAHEPLHADEVTNCMLLDIPDSRQQCRFVELIEVCGLHRAMW